MNTLGRLHVPPSSSSNRGSTASERCGVNQGVVRRVRVRDGRHVHNLRGRLPRADFRDIGQRMPERVAHEATRQRAGGLAVLECNFAGDHSSDVTLGLLHSPPGTRGQIVNLPRIIFNTKSSYLMQDSSFLNAIAMQTPSFQFHFITTCRGTFSCRFS